MLEPMTLMSLPDFRMMFNASVLSAASFAFRASTRFIEALWLKPPHEDLVTECISPSRYCFARTLMSVFASTTIFSFAIRLADSNVTLPVSAFMRMLLAFRLLWTTLSLYLVSCWVFLPKKPLEDCIFVS